MKFVVVSQSLTAAAILLFATGAVAQSAVPVRELSAPTAKSADRFGSILGVREIANGKLLVNDGRRRQLSVLDATFANKTIVLDSVPTARQGYGRSASPIIPYLADSTLFVDYDASSLLVIDPQGGVARIASPPKANDLRSLASQSSGTDGKGNLLYIGEGAMIERAGVSDRPDSQPVVRANFETRTVDTIGKVLRSVSRRTEAHKVGDDYVYTIIRNPLPTFDGWASLPDGTIAIVRGQDYHVDFISPDGSRYSGPKLPFDWKRLTDADKQKLIDSARVEREKRDNIPNAMPSMVSAASVVAAANGGPPVTRANQPKQLEREVEPREIPDRHGRKCLCQKPYYDRF